MSRLLFTIGTAYLPADTPVTLVSLANLIPKKPPTKRDPPSLRDLSANAFLQSRIPTPSYLPRRLCSLLTNGGPLATPLHTLLTSSRFDPENIADVDPLLALTTRLIFVGDHTRWESDNTAKRQRGTSPVVRGRGYA